MDRVLPRRLPYMDRVPPRRLAVTRLTDDLMQEQEEARRRHERGDSGEGDSGDDDPTDNPDASATSYGHDDGSAAVSRSALAPLIPLIAPAHSTNYGRCDPCRAAAGGGSPRPLPRDAQRHSSDIQAGRHRGRPQAYAAQPQLPPARMPQPYASHQQMPQPRLAQPYASHFPFARLPSAPASPSKFATPPQLVSTESAQPPPRSKGGTIIIPSRVCLMPS